ncbi:LamG domain-containing protein [Flavobacterium aquiphilum]|uniref:LamG domain-containing protein n=1 Tax=Flavobacterium aquiphilum TaxID=3003261 RepID=UPI0024807FD6|nr:LamG domain-containing protein [Flavobacterium aquiphilum]
MTSATRLITILFVCFSLATKGQNSENKTKTNTEWLVANLLREKSNTTEISGNPQITNSPYGEAVAFNGKDDALFLNELPLNSLQEFTLEMIFKPDLNGVFEQRVLHIGESRESRILLEIRAVDSNWYFDVFAVSGTNKKPLASEKLIHPLGKWYHVAFVVTPNKLTSYVNGKLELQEAFTFLPITTGKTAIGVRLNKVSWFKGDIYKIRITPKEIKPDDFMPFLKDETR